MKNEDKILSILQQMQMDIGTLKSDVASMKSNIGTLDSKVDRLELEVSAIKATMSTKEELENISSHQQDDILSLLKIIHNQGKETNNRLDKHSKDTLFLHRKIVEHEEEFLNLKL